MPTGKAGGRAKEGCVFHEFCKGAVYTVVGAVRTNGTCPAREFLDSLSAEKRAKLFALFRRLADVGHITDRKQFKKIEENFSNSSIFSSGCRGISVPEGCSSSRTGS